MDYDKLVKAKPGIQRKPQFEAGVEATVLITEARYIDGFKGKNVVLEMRVLDSKGKSGSTPPAVGDERACVFSLDSEWGYKNLITMLQALNGDDFPGLSEEQKKEMLAQNKTLQAIESADTEAKKKAIRFLFERYTRGSKVRLMTRAALNKDGSVKLSDKGVPYVNIDWRHVQGQTFATIEAAQKELDAETSLDKAHEG